MHPRPLPLLPLFAPLAVLVPSVARAGDPAAAQALFDRGKQLMLEGRYAEACPKFEESQRIDSGVGTQFQLANCWQRVGRTASAWALFKEVESQARALGQTGRERVAHDRAGALEPWLSKIAIVPHGADASLPPEIRRDGTIVGREQWGVAVPVDPGVHAVTVVAGHGAPWQTTVEVPPDGKVVTVDVITPASAASAAGPHPLSAGPAATAGAVGPGAAPGTVGGGGAGGGAGASTTGVTSAMPPSVLETPTMKDTGSVQRAIGWFFVGAGVVGVVAGAYYAAKWLQDSSAADGHCPGGNCDATGTRLRSDAHTEGQLTEATLGAGGAAGFVGGVLVASAPGLRPVATSGAPAGVAPAAGAPSAHEGLGRDAQATASGRIEVQPLWLPAGVGLGLRVAF